MMNAVRGVVLSVLMLAAAQVSAACQWPAWEQFKKEYISAEGRIIDPSDARKITTSEGQSYGLFFALAANDRSRWLPQAVRVDAKQPCRGRFARASPGLAVGEKER